MSQMGVNKCFPVGPPDPSLTDPPSSEKIKFRFLWPVRVMQRQLNHNDAIILHISPKFATAHDHVAFQWTVKMHGSANLDSDDAEELDECSDYIAFSLYLVDAPIPFVDVTAKIDVVANPGSPTLYSKSDSREDTQKYEIRVSRGRETELCQLDKAKMSAYIKDRIGKIVKLSIILELDAGLFKTDQYLNEKSPTPVHSFLTANYRARVRSKVWKKRSKHGVKRPRSASEGNTGKFDLEQAFNRVMERERDRLETIRQESLEDGQDENSRPNIQIEGPLEEQEKGEHLFKQLLVACCDSCERRASLIPAVSTDELDTEEESVDDIDNEAEENAFECPEENKAEIHDMLANMYFNKVALPQMEFVEDFANFLIDAEMNDLPVLKRACERYLCGELNSKKDLLTSLLLDLLLLAMVFDMPIMKSMLLTELVDRFDEYSDVDKLLQIDEYKKLDNRIHQMSDRNLFDLVDECKKFREQQKRVEILS